MKAFLFILTLVVVTSCASWESKFTSHVGCPAEEVKVIKRSENYLGVQDHTVSCRGVVYHCTEEMKDFVPRNLRCTKAQAPARKVSTRK